ncbi:GNAT family N-acetyltransferase [Kribbella antibiotica]|uniref:GNAT family N-acetyltransferase n=1 Tax=Kribbella antibiotica TaxID=190195 RepID=A0A4R4YVE3_9ACTN|nr:GNAT family N-acetyltransferase [Kribbella antibiotica]TDD49375.1 GNAT family N-acetyltransferase [Kribbella antibiotica]
MNRTLIRQRPEFAEFAVPALDDVVLRSPLVADIAVLGRLYFAAYEPGVAAESEAEEVDDIRLTFDGSYGVLDGVASRLAWCGDELVGAILVVERAPWADTPDCRFIVELFTAVSWRRRGLARVLLAASAQAVNGPLALRVADDNHPARALYASCGFTDWAVVRG